MEIQRYLETGSKFDLGKEVIQRNTDTVQAVNTPMCGHLCLFELKSLTSDEQFQTILNHTQHYGDIHKVIRKIPFKPKKGFLLPKHRYTGPYNPLHLQLDPQDNPLSGNEPYNAGDAISMCHDICYRDNEMSAGIHECDPKGRREKVDRQLVRNIIGLKHRMGLGIHWTNQVDNQLNKPVRRRFDKRTVFASR